ITNGPVPGPMILLTRGQPVEVALVKEMGDPTAVHWHGIELESYFDGVPGWRTSGGTSTTHRRRPDVHGQVHAAARGHVYLPHALARRGAAGRRRYGP